MGGKYVPSRPGRQSPCISNVYRRMQVRLVTYDATVAVRNVLIKYQPGAESWQPP